MTDPSNALQSLQQELLLHGKGELRSGVLDQNLFLVADSVDGVPRFSYIRLEGQTVTALVMFGLDKPIDGLTCFALGYAVPEAYRNQGRAKDAIRAGIAELQHGLAGKLPVFYVEAVVAADNKPSQRIAEQIISDTPVTMTDQISGLPAFRYVRRIEGTKVGTGDLKR